MKHLNPYAKAFVALTGPPIATLLGNWVIVLQEGGQMNWTLQAVIAVSSIWTALLVYFTPNTPKEETSIGLPNEGPVYGTGDV